MSFDFSKYCKVIINGTKVILGNIETGAWIRISKEVYDILNMGIENNISICELKLKLYDNEDREYMGKLYEKLLYMGIINDNEDNKILKNKIASFEITHRCNLNCIHCCIDADGVISNKKDLELNDIKLILDKLIEWNPQRIMLSGGEPMLRNDFIDILMYLKDRYDGEITLSTNGTLFNKNNVDIISKCVHQVDISLDGVDEETCSIVRGVGVFDRVINNIKLLQSTGFNKIAVSMATADKNEYLEDKFIELNKKLGTKPLIRQFSAVGRGKDNKHYFTDIKENEVHIPKKYLEDSYNDATGMCSCNAGQREIFISYNGDIYPCPSFINKNFVIGNILNNDINRVLNEDIRSYKLLKKYNYKQFVKCEECKVNLFCWTCPGNIEELKDRPDAIEDKCNKIKSILYKRVWER